MGWSVILNNGEKIDETIGRVDSWRNLHDYCKLKNLRIRRMYYNDEPLDYGATYFVFFHVDAFLATGYHVQKKAVGITKNISTNKGITTKAYIDWYLLPSDTKLVNERTVKNKNTDIEAFGIIDDIGILGEK